MNQFLKSLIQKFRGQNLTDSEVKAENSESREVLTPSIREVTGYLSSVFSSRIKVNQLSVTRLQTNRKQTNKNLITDNRKPTTDSLCCPYCLSRHFQKRGFRQKKHEKIQLYLCLDCRKTFTPQITKGKHYPLAVMLDAISIYNLGYSLEETCGIVNRRMATKKSAFADLVRLTDLRIDWTDNLNHRLTPAPALVNTQNELGVDPPGVKPGRLGLSVQSSKSAEPTPKSVYQNGFSIQPSTLSNWIAETEPLCRYCQMRPYIMQKYQPKDVVLHATLAHRQLYRYRFHRGKCQLLINHEYRHRRFQPLMEFLEAVPAECPHQYFNEGERASETPLTFSKTAMIVRGKQNFATRLCEFVLQSVKDRKLRHEAVQKFMLANDSVTVATEVPVYMTKDDIEHMKTQLGFEIYSRVIARSEATKQSRADGIATPLAEFTPSITGFGARNDQKETLPKLITGHIDILQIRNGMVHILDYKPKAEKERPIEQLTLYAMALSRLTGLRLFEFKCAWFDEKDYFEFYPLHVLHKPRRAQRRRKVNTQEGTYLVNKNEKKVESIRPI